MEIFPDFIVGRSQDLMVQRLELSQMPFGMRSSVFGLVMNTMCSALSMRISSAKRIGYILKQASSMLSGIFGHTECMVEVQKLPGEYR